MTSPPAIDQVALDRIDQVPLLAGPDRRIEALPGGLTNQILKISTSDGIFVARLAGDSSDLLGIERDAEHVNSAAAASTGISPEVLEYRPELGLLVVRWVSGRTLSEPDLRDETMLGRVAAACRTLHAGPAFGSTFDMFARQRQYLDTVLDNGFRLPDRYMDFMPQVERIRSVLAVHPLKPVPCHNDLLAANFLDADPRLWIIDFEYSGTNDPCFELGNIASEAHLSDEHRQGLVDDYFGRHSPVLQARTRLQAVMSQYGWTLWGVIQHGVSDLEVDFWGWAMDKYDRAAATFTDPEFDLLLDAAAEP